VGTRLITATRKSLVKLKSSFTGDLDSKAFGSKAFGSKASVNFSPKRAEDPLALVAPSPTLIRAFFCLKCFYLNGAM